MFCRVCNHAVIFDHHDYVKVAIEGNGVAFYHLPCLALVVKAGGDGSVHINRLIEALEEPCGEQSCN